MSRKSSLLGLGTEKKGAKDGEDKEGFRPLSPQPPALTAVILHDAAYKHKFSRPKTSKAELATIVERPERITAAIMGVCAAQTRLGGHKLSIHKTRRFGSLQDPEVMLVHASGGDKGKWLSELTQLCNGVDGRHRRGECEIPSGKGWNSGDLYLGPSSKEALEGCVGAVYEAVDRVFTGADGAGVTRRAFVAIRPPGHHCAETTPSGFCWLNNVHVGIAHAARVHGLTHAVILDIDLHHGDGSQAITWHLNDLLKKAQGSKLQPPSPVPKVAYFSLHDIESFPCEAGDPSKIRDASVDLDAHGQMIVNIHLKKYHTPAEFWEVYETVYSRLLSRAKEWLVREMDNWRRGGREVKAAVFISAGFDASEHEMSGMQRHKVHVPTGFYARFARESVALAEEEGTGCNGRVVSVLEGGYSNRAIMSGVLAHLVGLAYETPARAMFRHHQTHRGISEEYLYEDGVMGNSEYGMGPHGGTPGDFLGGEREGFAVDYYDPQWWDIEHLVELENKTAKRPKKVAPGAPVNYLSATAASKAKVEAKVLIKQAARIGNGPPPPPVIIDWATATVDLSKRLIPQEDQDEQPPSPTLSVASTTRGASKWHSVAGHGDEGLTKMVLRERKPKPTAVEERAASRAGGDRRRKSVAGVVTSPALTVATAPITRSGRVPPMQRIPSRGPSPAPGHGPPPAGGRRVVSMGMPPPLQRTSSTRRDGLGNLRGEARVNKSASTTPSPPPSVSMPPPAPGRGLRRVNSTSNIQISTGPITRGAARAAGKPGAAKKGASPPPQSLPQGQDSEGDSIEDALVKGMKKIRITYKAGEEAQKQQQQQQPQSRPSSGSSGDKDARVRELERLAEEKQREIEQLKKEAKERKKGVEKSSPAPASVPAVTGANVSAVRMAAMKLEASGGPGKVGKLQTQVGGGEAGKGGSSPGTPTSRSPLGQSPFAASTPPQAQPTTAAKQPPAGKGGKQLPKPINTTTESKPANPPTQNVKLAPTTNGGIKMTTTASSPTTATPTAMGPPPQIITIPPTRPTSSWDHDLTATGANGQGIGMLGIGHEYEYDAGEEDHVQNNVNTQENGNSGEGASEMSPPPPYSTAVRAEQGQGQQGQQQGVQGQARQAAGGFGFNVMKPLTVGLGGGGAQGQ